MKAQPKSRAKVARQQKAAFQKGYTGKSVKKYAKKLK